ncbi:hypothetical protein ACFYYH_33755 [Streptomyces sp. NPDC002018]|uniref:hypothetical protein n=1 Tax=Streptomyces sp. NPDC002018 TaxID=3364629 RepID=UPI0036D0F482
MSMRVGSGGSRAALCRVALVTALAGLLHLLGCAHGPQPAGVERSDTLAAVTSTGSEADSAASVFTAAAVRATPDRHDAAGCADVDEPATASPRVDVQARPWAGGGMHLPEAADGESARGRAPCRAGEDRRSRAEYGRTRAVLGVWRT